MLLDGEKSPVLRLISVLPLQPCNPSTTKYLSIGWIRPSINRPRAGFANTSLLYFPRAHFITHLLCAVGLASPDKRTDYCAENNPIRSYRFVSSKVLLLHCSEHFSAASGASLRLDCAQQLITQKIAN
jgi:hypothetical protein